MLGSCLSASSRVTGRMNSAGLLSVPRDGCLMIAWTKPASLDRFFRLLCCQTLQIRATQLCMSMQRSNGRALGMLASERGGG